MTHDADILAYLNTRGVSRLVHFTQSRNLPSILADGELRDVASMRSDPFRTFAASDDVRADGHPDKLSFSIEYPNAYYLRDARQRTHGFPDWIALLLQPHIAAKAGALFSPYNAANGGAPRVTGRTGVEACYAPTIRYARVVHRALTHDPRCPTDIQAEVLIPGPIPLSDVIGIVVESAEDAHLERDRLTHLHHDPDRLKWLVSPGLFQIPQVFRAVRQDQGIDIFDLDGGPHE